MQEEKSLAIRDKKVVFIAKAKAFIKKCIEIYKELMSVENRAQTITIFVYIACFILNIIYTPWANNVSDALVSEELTNERFHFFFFDSIFYGISELIDLLSWAGNIFYVIFAVAILSLKDICKGVCLSFANGEFENIDEELKTNEQKWAYYKKQLEKQRRKEPIANKSFKEMIEDFKSNTKEKIREKLNDFMVDNILLYLCTLLLYFLTEHGMAILDATLGTDMNTFSMIVMWILLLLIIIYAIPNLIKLFLYVAAITILGSIMGKAESMNIFSNLTMSIISCCVIICINKVVGMISDKFSEKLYTKEGIKSLKEMVSNFWHNKSIDSSLRVTITLLAPLFVPLGEYYLIKLTLYMISM